MDDSRVSPLPRCVHDAALRDHAGEALEPPCGCRVDTPTEEKRDSKFTPGPWRVEDVKGGPYGKFLCVVAEANNRESIVQIIWHNTAIRPVDEANASLIAAAPALYEACRDALEDVTGPITASGIKIRYSTRDKLIAALALVDGNQNQETK